MQRQLPWACGCRPGNRSQHYLPRILTPFLKEYPQIKVNIVEEIFLAVPRDHPINAGYPEDAQERGAYPSLNLSLMKNEPFIGLKKIQKFSAIGRRLCNEAGFEPHTICETLNWETVHMMIASGIWRDYALVQRPGTVLSDVALILEDSLRTFFRKM